MGFGGATAWLFAREGAKVVVTDVIDERGEATAAAIRSQGTGGALSPFGRHVVRRLAGRDRLRG